MEGHNRDVVLHILEVNGVKVHATGQNMWELSKGGVKRSYRLPDLLSDPLWDGIKATFGVTRADEGLTPKEGPN